MKTTNGHQMKMINDHQMKMIEGRGMKGIKFPPLIILSTKASHNPQIGDHDPYALRAN